MKAGMIDYEAFNEEHGNADVSDEEEAISRNIADAKSTKSRATATNSKFDKMIKAQAMEDVKSAKGRFQFANYFVSVKTAPTKLTKQDEAEAVKLFVEGEKAKNDDDVPMEDENDQSE